MIQIQPAVNDEIPSEDALHVTDAALAHLVRRMQQHENAIGIMVGVKKAGCSGLKYDIFPIREKLEQAFTFTFDDQLTLYVPHDSFPFLKGCTLDYVKQGLNAQLRVVNPNETGSCGCGESFSVADEESEE